jgi:hypothetical protein
MGRHVHGLEPEYHEKLCVCSELESAICSYAQGCRNLFFLLGS